MLLVRWIGEAPPEKGEWQDALRGAFADPSGQHRVRLWRGSSGWRFDVGRRTRPGWDDDAFGRAGVDVVRRVRDALADAGADLDAGFDPFDPAQPGPPAADTDGVDASAPGGWPARPVGRLPARWLAVAALAAAIGLLAWRALQEPVVTPPPPGADSVAMRERLRELEDEVARLQQQEAAEAVPASPRELSPAPRPAPARRSTPRPPAAPATPASVPPSIPAPMTTLVPTTTPTTTPPPTSTALAPTPTTIPAPAAVEPGTLVELTDPQLTRPVLVSEDRPRYPPAAQRAGIEGSVVVSAVVTETGVIGPLTVVRASPRGLGFEDEALRFVRTRRYRPATKQGVPVRVRMEMLVEFRRPARSR